MSIHDLPTELILAIEEFCEPRDAYNLAFCCREFYNLLNEAIAKHRRLWRYWNTIDTKLSKKPFHAKLLKLARKPHLARYIEAFKCEFEYEEPDAYSTFEEHELVHHLEAFGKTRGHNFDDFKVRSWSEHYTVGLRDLEMRTLSSYLINITPNLRRLECFGDSIGEEDLLKLFVDIARASSGTAILPLQQLRSFEVKLDRNIDEGGLPADWLLACMHLPCLETFATSRMNGVIRHFNIDNVPNSNITRIVLQASTFDADTLIQVLSRINALKSFAQENGQDNLVYELDSFSAKKITTALVKYACHSLEHLTMLGEDQWAPLCIESGEELLYVSLAGFQRLKTLRCSTYLLTSDPQSPRPNEPLASGLDLVDCSSDEYWKAVQEYKSDDYLHATPETLRRLAFTSRLPPSLKALHFEDYPCHAPLAYSALCEFIQRVDGVLPRLKQIYLSDWGVDYVENKGLLGIVAQKGLKYKRLPDPFKVGTLQRGGYDSQSENEDESDDESEN
ncbi:hypothetical protein EKO04_006688 [Ascochyta lentis]|uniref:F-box domain-containing protein n=1 Tax=Ascochyta lentis TaxID=205686 RepID=A0A8H7J4S7_9PLEO|nr:hypothetical protein EKO04_006688 [Ascochyta lentis]